MEPIAYLALEIKQRELESRVVIAARLLKSGIAVAFGQQWSLFVNHDRLPPGVVLFKTVNEIQAKGMADFRASGHLVAATDEEVLVCTEDECFLEVFSPLAAENCDLFFAQSKLHQDVVERRFPALRGRTQTVGNSRADFLSARRRDHHKLEVAKIRETYEPYILFNTNYAQLNSIWEEMKHVASIAAQAGLLKLDDAESIAEYKMKWEWERQNREAMFELLQWTLDNFPQKNIVLRPHPGEIPDFWTDRFGGRERLHIIPRSDPHPWILGADLVVHTTCTTGLEAALMGKPVVNVVPATHPTFDFVTSQVNPTFGTWEEASAAMSTFFESGGGPIVEGADQRAGILATHFAMDGKETTEKIADSLVTLLQDHGAGVARGVVPKMRGEGFRRANRSDLTKDKFVLEAEELSGLLQTALAGVGASIKVKLMPLDDSLFLLVPD